MKNKNRCAAMTIKKQATALLAVALVGQMGAPFASIQAYAKSQTETKTEVQKSSQEKTMIEQIASVFQPLTVSAQIMSEPEFSAHSEQSVGEGNVSQFGAADPQSVAYIPDANFKKALNEKLGKGSVTTNITIAEMNGLKGILDFSNKSISDITGVKHLTGATTLRFGSSNLTISSRNKITNVDGFAGANLPMLKELSLYRNEITNVDGFATANLPVLETLSLYENRITNVDGFATANLPMLTTLYLYSNKIADFTPLRNFPLNTNSDIWNQSPTLTVTVPTDATTATFTNPFGSDATTVDVDVNGELEQVFGPYTFNSATIQVGSTNISLPTQAVNAILVVNRVAMPTLQLSANSNYSQETMTITAMGADAGFASITLPDGTVVSGNEASYTVSEDGTYTFVGRTASGDEITETIDVQILAYIPDANFKAALNERLGQLAAADITIAQLSSIVESFDISWKSISNITGVRHLTGVSSLYLYGNEISSLDAFATANLPSLTTLNLHLNKITNVDGLATANLPALTGLYLHNNQITDVDGFATANLSALTDLSLSNNQITNVDGFATANLSALTDLILDDNQISSLDGFATANLPALTSLHLTNNKITNVDGLATANLPALTRLDLYYNQITNVDGFATANLSALTHLHLSNNQITNVNGFATANMSALTTLYLSNNQITNIDGFATANLSKLEWLHLQDNKIADFAPLKDFPLVGGHPWESNITNQSPILTVVVPTGATTATFTNPFGADTTTVNIDANGAMEQTFGPHTFNSATIQVGSTNISLPTQAVNATLVVQRVAMPTLSGVSDVLIEGGGAFDALAGITATDSSGSDITNQIQVTGTVDVNTPGVYELTYSVTDAGGQTATAKRTVTVGVYVPDANFKAALNATLGKPVDAILTKVELESLVGGLDYKKLGIRDLQGIQYMINVAWLDVTENNLTNVDAFTGANLPKLAQLYLGINEIEDLDGFAGANLAGLKTLSLSRNALTQIDGLSGATMGQLEVIWLDSNQLVNIDSLASLDLSKLQVLGLSHNNLVNLNGLTGKDLSALKNAWLDSNALVNVNGFTGTSVGALQNLDLSTNQLQDVSGLNKQFPSLENLYLNGNKLTSLAGMSGMQAPVLSTFDLYSNDLTSLDAVVTMSIPNVRAFNASMNNISDLSSWRNSNYQQLEEFWFYQNELTSVAGIGEMTAPKLRTMDLSCNAIVSTEAFVASDLPALQNLWLNSNSIADIQSFATAEFPNLQDLSLARNKIADFSPIASKSYASLGLSPQAPVFEQSIERVGQTVEFANPFDANSPHEWNIDSLNSGRHEKTHTFDEGTVVVGGQTYWVQAIDATLIVNITDMPSITAEVLPGFSGEITWQAVQDSRGTGLSHVILPNGDHVTGGVGVFNLSGTYKAQANGPHTFTVVDNNGNEASVTVDVNLIDRGQPRVNAYAVNADPTNGAVTINVDAWDNANESGIASIMFPNGTVVPVADGQYIINTSYEVTTNGTYEFRAYDKVGNQSVTQVDVMNIDLNAPNLQVFADSADWTNQNVPVHVRAWDHAGEFGIQGISLPDGTVHTVADGADLIEVTFDVTENGAYTVSAWDNVGNTTTMTYNVNWIERNAPNLQLTASTGNWVNDKVSILANAWDDMAGIASIELPNGTVVPTPVGEWALEVTFDIFANGTYAFKTTDKAGNVTTESITVNNIDATAPTMTIVGNPMYWTNQSAQLSVTAFESESGIASITLPNGAIVSGSTALYEVAENGSYTFTVRDNAGNQSSQTVTVSLIDKDKPTASVTRTVIGPKALDVTFTATDALSGVAKWRAPDGEWNEGWNGFTDTYRIVENGVYQFMVTDYAGNTHIEVVVVDELEEVIVPSGIDRIEYQLTGATTQGWTTYADPFMLVNEGVTLVHARAYDKAGNVSNIETKEVKIDKQRPINAGIIIKLQ